MAVGFRNARKITQKSTDTLARTSIRAKARGHDGVIIEGVTTLGKPGNYYVAFDPGQIKSAIGNRGSYSPSTADLTQ